MVMAISVPMAFASLSTPLLGIVDIAVVGQFGNATLIAKPCSCWEERLRQRCLPLRRHMTGDEPHGTAFDRDPEILAADRHSVIIDAQDFAG